MSSLFNQLVSETYPSLLKLVDNLPLTGEKLITDGFGNSTGLYFNLDGSIKASSYKIINGLNTQFLKADGSLDNRNFLLANSTTDDIVEGIHNLYFTNPRVLSTQLFQFVPQYGEITAQDSILTAIEKAWYAIQNFSGGSVKSITRASTGFNTVGQIEIGISTMDVSGDRTSTFVTGFEFGFKGFQGVYTVTNSTYNQGSNLTAVNFTPASTALIPTNTFIESIITQNVNFLSNGEGISFNNILGNLSISANILEDVTDRFIPFNNSGILSDSSISMDEVGNLTFQGSQSAFNLIFLSQSSNNLANFIFTNTAFTLDSYNNFIIRLGNNPIERFRILANTGFIGINKTNPTKLVDIAGDILINGITAGRGSGNVALNLAYGVDALLNNTTGDGNTAIGNSSLRNNTTTVNNTAVGYEAIKLLTGSNNTAVGYRSMYNGSGAAFSNTAVGQYSMQNITSGSNNASLGIYSLQSLTSGNYNTGIGSYSGRNLTTGNYNIYLGYYNSASTGSVQNEVVIGSNLTGSGSNTITIGGSTNTKTIFPYGTIILGSTSLVGTGQPLEIYHSNLAQIILRSSSGDNYVFGKNGFSNIFNIYNLTQDYEVFNIVSSGKIKFSKYGLGDFTGTAAFYLAVDSNGNIIETTGGGTGTITGIGTANYIPLWTSTSNLTSSSLSQDATGNINTNSKKINGLYLNYSEPSNLILAEATRSITGSYNTILGLESGISLSGGSYNIGVGFLSLGTITSANSCIGIGYSSLGSLTTGSDNIAIGRFALNSISSGTNNIALGNDAGRYISGSNNMYLGDNSGGNTPLTRSNEIVIGTGLTGIGNDSFTIGGRNKFLINSTLVTIRGSFLADASYPFYVNGNTKISGDSYITGSLYVQGEIVQMPGVYNYTFAGGANMYIAADGRIYRSTSSKKYKTNIKPFSKGLTDLLKLEPITYNSINKADKLTYAGLIAEELDKLGLKEFVNYENGNIEGINYGQLVVLLINSIKELNLKIKNLEKQNK